MKISEYFKSDRLTVSFEVFPPKSSAKMESVLSATEQIAALRPDFMSVTYGAGGGNSKATIKVAKHLKDIYGTTVVTHLTCVGETERSILEKLEEMKAAGIENIMALRGDLPEDGASAVRDFSYAGELIRFLKEQGDFCIGGACYPEIHPESANQKQDLSFLRQKVDSGCDYLVSQMFFDNHIFYNFLYKAREAGITVPIIPGVMPITNANQISRAVRLSNTNVPGRFRQIVDHFGSDPAAMRQAGIAYATEQIVDLLANGIRHIHVYSMNKPEVAEAILRNISELIK